MCINFSVVNSIVETTDGRYIKILEVEPINFTLRSDEESFNIISSFASWLKISPMRLQFKSVTRKADADKHVAMVHDEFDTEDSTQYRNLGEDYIKLIKDVCSREALTRRFFLIFQYKAVVKGVSDDYAKIYGMLQQRSRTPAPISCNEATPTYSRRTRTRPLLNPICVLKPPLLRGQAFLF